jgi:hypothetical protein
MRETAHESRTDKLQGDYSLHSTALLLRKKLCTEASFCNKRSVISSTTRLSDNYSVVLEVVQQEQMVISLPRTLNL